MNEVWSKPQVGNSVFQLREDGKYCIRRDVIGWNNEENKEVFSYILLKRKGNIWQQVGFNSASDAIAHADNMEK